MGPLPIVALQTNRDRIFIAQRRAIYVRLKEAGLTIESGRDYDRAPKQARRSAAVSLAIEDVVPQSVLRRVTASSK
jgi:hypothetical protein